MARVLHDMAMERLVFSLMITVASSAGSTRGGEGDILLTVLAVLLVGMVAVMVGGLEGESRLVLTGWSLFLG